LDFLLKWTNIIEDIRIERRGNERFGGTLPRMHDLQDFILDQEKEMRESDQWTPVSTLAGTFRDAGLGYPTAKAQAAFAFYKGKHPDIFEMVVRGPLRPLLNEAINLSEEDSLGNLRIAMDVAILIGDLASKHKSNRSKAQAGCSNCGASPENLLIRPNTKTLDEIVVCAQCGHTETRKRGKPQPGEGEGEAGEGKPQPGESGGESEPQPGESGGESEPQPGESGGESEPQPGEGEGKGEPASEGEGGKPERGEVDEDEGGDQPANNQWTPEELAQILLQLHEQGEKPQLHDFASAMGEALGERDKLRQKHLKRGEKPWCPYTLEEDKILLVSPGNRDAANALMAETRGMTSFLSARLRTVLLAQMIAEIEHGHRKGIRLSPRTLVDSKASLMGGEYPRRAFTLETEGLEVSFSASIVIDQSGSMDNQQGWMTRCLLALAVPLDRLDCPTLIAGFQRGTYGRRTPTDARQYHRTGGVRINMFKPFGRPLRSVLPKLANIQTSGGTPMADGIQFGLHALRDRPETHRVMFVITDGAPDGGHVPVIQWQKRMAKESGIHIVGIGVGTGARRVCSLFEDYIWVPAFEQLPNPLLVKLSMLINPTDRRHQKPLRIGGDRWGARR
jgi:hypothetical protein